MLENNLTQTCFAKNLNKLNFSSLISVSVDANANIKTVLNTECYLYDCTVDPVDGKMIVSGKIGVKVLYVDTDNITNTVTDSQSFSETLADACITAESIINICNQTTNCNVVQSENVLKINCDVSISPVVYTNISLNTGAGSYDNLIVKKSEVTTCVIDQKIDTNFEYTTSLECKDNISKILLYNAHFTPSKLTPQDGVIVVEGKLYSKLLYETLTDSESEIKELNTCFTVKTDVPVANLTNESLLDVSFCIDKNNLDLVTEIDEGNNVVVVKHCIHICGVSATTLSIDLIDDMYSVENELELNFSSKDFYKLEQNNCVSENVSGELSIDEDESAIDSVISNTNIMPEITNSYVKDDCLYVEGIISSQLIYLDENKEYKTKLTQLPFIINTKIKMNKAECVHIDVCITDESSKAKRGTIITLDYTLEICVCNYTSETRQLVDNFTINKQISFSNYDYQIFIAKPNETMWEICKRVKVSPDDICKYNQNLPQIFDGGEKVIIKRG